MIPKVLTFTIDTSKVAGTTWGYISLGDTIVFRMSCNTAYEDRAEEIVTQEFAERLARLIDPD